MNTLRYDVVMFDLDGTLIDTMGDFADIAADEMARAHGYDFAHARRRYLETSGIPFRQQLEVIAPGDPRNQGVSDRFEQRKIDASNSAMMDEGTVAGLRALLAAGVRLVVSSSSAQHHVDHFAERSQRAFPQLSFALALGFGHGLAKGAPHVTRVLEALAVVRERLLFVGDSIKDGDIAREMQILGRREEGEGGDGPTGRTRHRHSFRAASTAAPR